MEAIRRLRRLEARRARALIAQCRLAALETRRAYGLEALDSVAVDKLVAPQEFSLKSDDQHRRLVGFLQQLRVAVGSGGTVQVDFRKTEMMFSDGTLLFFSELSRLKEMFPQVRLCCIPSKVNRVNQVLQHLRIFELFGYQSAVVPSRPDVVAWRTISSAVYDSDAVGKLIEKYGSLRERSWYLFRSATEAMGNAVRHAYLEDRRDGLPEPASKKWWMFVREAEGELTVALCDLGIGIPRSLPIKYPTELIHSALATVAGVLRASTRVGKVDANMILAAMEINRTRTGVAGRGKGLTDLRRIVDEVAGGSLVLISNRGRIIYSNGVFSKRGFERSIKGTLVHWTIPLS
ncbi:hypothetical protein [Stenotrophomonas maltophilia]|uniref:hypothetical protein n=1 Tax=Stenotrophomonas maltophilia TaxID=40324 RepID=UPI0012DB21CF|nr:hypothetical protein [Stenotrophomonas maltophilia]